MRSSERSVRTAHAQSPWEVFRVPAILGALTAVGLVSALIGDDGWDVLSWLTLFAPIAILVRAWPPGD